MTTPHICVAVGVGGQHFALAGVGDGEQPAGRQLAVDQTLHWANPGGNGDTHGTETWPYRGPIPIVTHVHGSHVPPISDGCPEAW